MVEGDISKLVQFDHCKPVGVNPGYFLSRWSCHYSKLGFHQESNGVGGWRKRKASSESQRKKNNQT